MVSHRDERLFALFARAPERQLSESNAQGIANTAWAVATVKHRDENLLAVLARAAELGLRDFNAQ